MADAYFEIEEYLWFTEYQQGNVNVGGLVFDDTIEEILGLGPEEVLTVYSDVLEESLNFAEGDFKGIHWPIISDRFALQETQGIPTRVKQSILNLALTSPLTPALIAHVHLDVLHGVDIFWEEVSDELQIHSSYANAVPYWWEWLYEELWIDMEEPQPWPPVTVLLDLLVNDLVNMRHEIEQEYLFNSMCFEQLFAWDDYVWGWDHLVDSPLANADTIQEIIGKVADDYLYLVDALVQKVKTRHVVEEVVFVFDAGTHEKYYLLTAADTIDFSDVLREIFGHLVYEALSFEGVPLSGLIRHCSAEDAVHAEDDAVSERYYLLLADEIVDMTDGEVAFLSLKKTVMETLNASATAVHWGSLRSLATESLNFVDIDSYIHGLVIQEGLDLGDAELTRWVFNVLVASGCDIADIIG